MGAMLWEPKAIFIVLMSSSLSKVVNEFISGFLLFWSNRLEFAGMDTEVFKSNGQVFKEKKMQRVRANRSVDRVRGYIATQGVLNPILMVPHPGSMARKLMQMMIK
ncbi:hypothetical protein NE237_015262 [Protea cynaroides]|uniref:Uncharacterized protein n=1 Tax=Protea cynaroides TaxID=273540 RepID=A0A9Q0KDL8_9MAGN|nr:hypothetical protein NE237_015262 [Protea cynaroides]